MFERYTDRARRVIFFARYETSLYGASRIETEHLLLGLCREDPESFQDLLHLPADEVRNRVAERLERKPEVAVSIDLPLSDESERILAFAGEESEQLSHGRIGPVHILLGILREPECAAARTLSGMGAVVDRLRDAVAKKPASEFAAPFFMVPTEKESRSRFPRK
jgi:ATP-dependent Clp protease ATP-binding subunit ClpC